MKNLLIAILFFTLVIYILFAYFGSAFVKRKIRDLYQNEKYDEYFAYLDSKLCKFLVREHERDEYKYKVYLKKNDRKHIDEYFDKVLSRNVDSSTRLQYQIKAFYYYMNNNAPDKCAKLFEEIKGFGDQNVTKQITYLYEVIVLRKTNYIDEIKQCLVEKPNDPFYEYVLSESYKNIGDNSNAKKYKKSYKEHMKS